MNTSLYALPPHPCYGSLINQHLATLSRIFVNSYANLSIARMIRNAYYKEKSKKNIMRSLFLFLFIIPFLASCDPFNTDFADIENAEMYESSTITTPPTTSPSKLKVLTWNIKFGGGRIDMFFDCHGNRVLMSESEVLSNLKGLADAINTIDPDIVFMQEVDTLSKRSAYINQVQWLLDHTQMNYGAYASQWKADFVPSDGVGKVDSGSAILSRWPLKNAKRHALPKIGDQDALTQYFYLKRNYLIAETTPTTGKTVSLLTIHTSAFSKDGTKKKQLDLFLEAMDKINAEGKTLIAGGDFNSIPPNSVKTKNFPDSVCTNEAFQADDYSQETDWLNGFYSKYNPAILQTAYQADNSKYFTHTTDKTDFWNRKIDYIFSNQTVANSITYQDSSHGGIHTMPLSDHAPLSTEVTLP